MITIYRDISSSQIEVEKISKKNAIFKTAIMALDEVQISVVVDEVLSITEGDYIIHDGVQYTLNRDPEYAVNSYVQFTYDLIFEHPQYRLIDKLLSSSVTGSPSFTMTGKLSDFVHMLVTCVNKSTNPEGVDNGWTVGNVISSEYKTLTIEDLNCRDALRLFAKEFDCEYYFSGSGKVINFPERVEKVTSHVFEYGRGFGLYKITQRNVDKQDTVTRVYVKGGNKNVPPAYADEEGYLKLPEGYLEDFSESSKVVERQVEFEEVFPRFIGSVATVAGENNRVITCPAIDFDIQAVAVGSNARINFLTGDLMGKSFEFEWDNTLKQVTLIDIEDELALPGADGIRPSIPSASKKANVGDEFNFTGLNMPQSYVTNAIDRLRDKGTTWLNYYSKKRVKFDIDIDYRWMRDKDPLAVGDLVVISIPQNGVVKAIRITQLEVRLNSGQMVATVSNYLDESWEKYRSEKADELIREIIERYERQKDTFGKNTTFFAKPRKYKKGDTWFLLDDTVVGGILYKKGTLLQAVYETGTEDDWRQIIYDDPTDTTDGINLIRNYDLRYGFTHWGGSGLFGEFTQAELEALPQEFYIREYNALGDEYGYEYALTTDDDELLILDE